MEQEVTGGEDLKEECLREWKIKFWIFYVWNEQDNCEPSGFMFTTKYTRDLGGISTSL